MYIKPWIFLLILYLFSLCINLSSLMNALLNLIAYLVILYFNSMKFNCHNVHNE